MKTKNIKQLLLSFSLLLCFISGIQAQTVNPYYSIDYTDSVVKGPNSDFLYNNFSLTNVFNKNITLEIEIKTPDGWRMLGQAEQQIDLAPGENTIIPLTLTSLPTTIAKWEPVSIQIHLKNAPKTSINTFYVKVSPTEAFYASPHGMRTELTSYTISVPLNLYIRNKGNLDEKYKVHISNPYFNIDKELQIHINAGRDTNFVYALKISKGQWKNLHEQNIKIEIRSKKNNNHFYSYNYIVKRIQFDKKQHPSPYETFPFSAETGVTSAGNSPVSYYWGASGAIKFNSYSDLSFNYRSRQYGVYGYQQDIFTINYNYKQWNLSAGVINAPLQFANSGMGIMITKYWGKNNEEFANIFGLIPYANSPFSSKDIGGMTRYKLHKLTLMHTWAADFNAENHTNSFLENNEITVIDKKKLQLILKGGIGFDHSTLKLKDNPNNIIGKSLGYQFKYSFSIFNFASNILINDNAYPGIYKGYRNINNNASVNFKNTFFSLFYQYNYFAKNYFLDSIYITNVATQNISNYGVSTGFSIKNFSAAVSTGVMSQTSPGYSMPKYQSYGLNLSYNARNINVNFNAMTGYFGTFKFDNNDLAIVTQNASILSKMFGIQEYYYRMPKNNTDVKPTSNTPIPYSETINISPFINLQLLRKKMGIRLQYNYVKNSDLGQFNSAGGAISYHDQRLGLYVSANGYIPIGRDFMNRYVSFNIKKSFNVPIITNRKYYNLTMVFFEDLNGNGIYDKTDVLMPNVQVGLNEMKYITDAKGEIALKNMDPVSYSLDLIQAKGIRGFIPTHGYHQSVTLNKNKTLYIPFKQSKYVFGRVRFILTSAHSFLSLDHIKVTATDSAGNKYEALTDDNGDYAINLPANKYTISLNPEAFDERMQPKQMSYQVDLMNNDQAQVIFVVKQKKREVQMMKVSF